MESPVVLKNGLWMTAGRSGVAVLPAAPGQGPAAAGPGLVSAGLRLLPGRLVAGGVLAGDAVGIPVRGVAAAVHCDDRGGNPLLQVLDLEATFLLVLVRLHGALSCEVKVPRANETSSGTQQPDEPPPPPFSGPYLWP